MDHSKMSKVRPAPIEKNPEPAPSGGSDGVADSRGVGGGGSPLDPSRSSPLSGGPDWSAGDSALKNYSDRLTTAYLGKNWRSDIAFYVEDEDQTIPAHSLIVAAASPVLERCCFGTGDCVQPVAVIRVPNCSANSFWVVLRHLYASKEVELQPITDRPNADALEANIGLTIGNAAEVLCLADYYNLQQLRSYCESLLLAGINCDNACEIYGRVRLLDDQRVAARCMQKMVFNMGQVMSSAMEMDDEAAIAEFLRADDLRLKDETELFDAMYKWTEDTCPDGSGSGRRELMRDRLQHVRFGCMTPSQFAHCIDRAGAGFFSVEEVGTILHRIALGHRFVGANPFEIMPVKGDDQADENKSEDKEMDENIPMPYWCGSRAPMITTARSVVVAQEDYSLLKSCFHSKPFPVDDAFEYALTGLTIPHFEGTIMVRQGKAMEWKVINTEMKNDIVCFEPEVRLDNSNCHWDLEIASSNHRPEAYIIKSKIDRGNLRFVSQYTQKVLSAVHFVKWRRTL